MRARSRAFAVFYIGLRSCAHENKEVKVFQVTEVAELAVFGCFEKGPFFMPEPEARGIKETIF